MLDSKAEPNTCPRITKFITTDNMSTSKLISITLSRSHFELADYESNKWGGGSQRAALTPPVIFLANWSSTSISFCISFWKIFHNDLKWTGRLLYAWFPEELGSKLDKYNITRTISSAVMETSRLDVTGRRKTRWIYSIVLAINNLDGDYSSDKDTLLELELPWKNGTNQWRIISHSVVRYEDVHQSSWKSSTVFAYCQKLLWF